MRLFTRGGVALQEPCVNRDMRIERLALDGGTIKGQKPANNGPNLRASPGERGQILCPMLTRETCVESVVTIEWRNWLILRHDQNGTRVAAMSKSACADGSHYPPASSRQLRGAITHLFVESGNSDTTLPARDAKMPACGTEGRGSIVVKCRTVMGRTRRRLPG